jgi:hypothetical protein
MKKILTTQEAGRLGGIARAKKLSKKRKIEIAKMGNLARQKSIKSYPQKHLTLSKEKSKI